MRCGDLKAARLRVLKLKLVSFMVNLPFLCASHMSYTPGQWWCAPSDGAAVLTCEDLIPCPRNFFPTHSSYVHVHLFTSHRIQHHRTGHFSKYYQSHDRTVLAHVIKRNKQVNLFVNCNKKREFKKGHPRFEVI